MTPMTPIPAHLAAHAWYAPHQAWVLATYGECRHDPAGAEPVRARLIGEDLSSLYLDDIDLTGACLVNSDLSDSDLIGAKLAGADLVYASFAYADLTGVDLTGAIGLPVPTHTPEELRRLVAEQIEAHPELHDQSRWGEGMPSECGTPCCVAGWACRLGGGRGSMSVSSAATVLLWRNGRRMPSFASAAPRSEILAALRS